MTDDAAADSPADRIIAALDTGSEQEALRWVERLSTAGIRRYKVGIELFYSSGPEIIEHIRRRGGDVFVDVKLHDIPNTVAGAVTSLLRHGPWMINLHAAGGAAMMEAARRAVDGAPEPPLLIGVTVLTSFSDDAWQRLGHDQTPEEAARLWTSLAAGAGLDGVVCSPEELPAVREAGGARFLTVTPGIRPHWAQRHDQRRVATPSQALERGADYLVIGRPLTGADDPGRAARRLLAALPAPAAAAGGAGPSGNGKEDHHE